MTQHSSALEAIAAKKPSALIARAALAQAAALASLPVERRNTIPILSNLRMKGDGESLTISGTDLDIEVIVRLEGAADSDFDTTIEASKFRDILAKAKASELASIDQLIDEGRAAIDLGGLKFTLQTLDANDYPIMPGPSDYSVDSETGKSTPVDFRRYDIPTKDLKTALDRTKFAISTEETRYYLNGVYLHWTGFKSGETGLSFVATDGHRLAKMEIVLPEAPIDLPGLIIPAKTAALVLKALQQMAKAKMEPETVSVECSVSKIKFTLGHVEIVSKVIDGTFPDYERVIPRHNDKLATFDRKAVSEAVEQVSLISAEKGRAVKMDFWNNACKLTVNNPDAGTAETSVQGTYACESGVIVGINAAYVRDVLDEMEGAEFTFTLSDSGSPILVHDLGEPRFMSVIMPMRV